MLLYSHIITPRLSFISDFIEKEILQERILLTTSIDEFKNFTGPKINYSNETITDDEFRISSRSISGSELLLEQNITVQEVQCSEVNGYKAFFRTEGDFPFDIFAASFYLLSRYEEYLPHRKDGYGRYAHQNSLAFRENFLHIPLVNIWLDDFREYLKQKFPSLITRQSTFTFFPTYDIDIAWSYKHKGIRRTVGGFIKSFFTLKWGKAKERVKVLRGKMRDPYDAYDWLHELHRQYDLHPYYFFLLAKRRARFDKNISPGKKAMRQLIDEHRQYHLGIHPSWHSGNKPKKMRAELRKLEQLARKKITSSRQHYIRFSLPQTFRNLIEVGIEKDFSMGYGSINGFRASVASPFYWYDLKKEEETNLLLYPFCFMDANSFFEQKFSSQQALEELRYYYNAVRSVNGNLITIWHNNFLGSSNDFEGWKQVYPHFIQELMSDLKSN